MSLWHTKQIRGFILVCSVYSSNSNMISILAIAVYLQEEEKNICNMLTYHIQVQIHLHV